MKNPTSDFPPLTPRQLELLEAIKAEKEKLRTLPQGTPKPGLGFLNFMKSKRGLTIFPLKPFGPVC